MLSNNTYLPETLALLRHGESEWNRMRDDLFLGNPTFTDADRDRSDFSFGLTEAGIEQAISLREALAEVGIDWNIVLTSELPRAKDTAKFALPHLVEIFKVDPGLNERDWGYESRSSMMDEYRPKWLARVAENPLDTLLLDGPSFRQFADIQVEEAAYDITSCDAPGINVAVFAHGETNKALLWKLLGLEDEVVEAMRHIPNVTGPILSSVEPETGLYTGEFRFARFVDPLSDNGQRIGDWIELTEPESILEVVGRREA